jgi:hypothetical protein
MENNIIELFGKKVRIIEDNEENLEEGCRKCVFFGVWGCDISSHDGSLLCEDSLGKSTRHFELV